MIRPNRDARYGVIIAGPLGRLRPNGQQLGRASGQRAGGAHQRTGEAPGPISARGGGGPNYWSSLRHAALPS